MTEEANNIIQLAFKPRDSKHLYLSLTGVMEQFGTGFERAIDVVQDSEGRLWSEDYGNGNIYLLERSVPEETIILQDDFSNLDNWTDLTSLISWGNYPVGTSGFVAGVNNGQQAVFLNPTDEDAIDTTPYTGLSQPEDLKSFTALDFAFPEPIIHQEEILTIEFDARWDNLTNSGEAGRFMVVLMDDYPENGVKGEDLNNFNGDPFGTPALHLRIRPSNIAKSFLQYGGGNGGEFEKFGDNWWLPGFISNAEGTGSGSPGQGNEYPFGSWQETNESLGSEDWQTYTYKILPDRQEIYVEGQLVGSMDLPLELPTAPQYEYYEQFEALRLYWRGIEPTYISNFQITTQPFIETEANMLGSGVVVNEDFTNGAFNSETVDYWQLNGTGTGFRPPNNRDFNFALSNQIAAGGGSFSDNFAFSIPDATTTHPSGLQQFGLAKEDEVAIVRYTTFSDIARNSREQFQVQVALLQTDPNLSGSPNFGHDLSIETETRFVSHSPSHPDRLQFTANVENAENITPAQKNAYYSNKMTAADLDREYSNLVIWRDLPGAGGTRTNIEQWASNAIGDYDVAAEMSNQFEPNVDPDYAFFNEVRVFLQRGGTNVDLIRDNVSINDAQIGIKDLHVGITKKTDFNLDYRTDARDFMIWNTYYNSSNVTPTMLTGDADNNNAIELADWELWKLNRGLIHDPNFDVSQSVYTYDANAAINPNYLIPTANNSDPIFAYNPLTGELAVNTQGESLISWIIQGQLVDSIVPLGNNWWIESVGNTYQWVDLDLLGFTSNELVTIANLSPGLNNNDLSDIEVGFTGGGRKLVTVNVINDEPNTTDLVAELKFEASNEATLIDSSPGGNNNVGTLNNGANLQNIGGDLGSVVNFDGVDDYIFLANSTDINLGIHQQRTISLWFQAEDINITSRQQVLYEEGGGSRGLNIYLDAGKLYVGGWNIPESNWTGTYLTTDQISSNQWHHVALVLDGETTVQSDSFIAYLDGEEFARGEGSQLWGHGDPIGLGNVKGGTKFHQGSSSNLKHGFKGNLDQLQIYNRALNDTEVNSIYEQTTPPITELNSEEGLIAELEFAETSGTLAIDSSPFGQDNSGSLLNGADFANAVGNATGLVNFDGVDDYISLANSTDINLGIHQQRTISLWFQAEDINITSRQQVLYEEGGGSRGLNIYLDAGKLYVGGWNIPESNWTGTYLTTDQISSNQWHHVALVLDGETTVQSDSFIAYLDGEEFARGEGSQLWGHGDPIGLGNVNGGTKFHNGVTSNSNGFAGNLDEFKIYNRALDNLEVNDLFTFSESIFI